MTVSISRVYRRSCPACSAEVVSELWLIVHRHERPKLWSRAPELHILTCPNGHRGLVHAALLLFDPSGPFIIYTPGSDASSADTITEGKYLMSLLWSSLPANEKPSDRSVELIPSEVLPFVLSSPTFNLGDMAPGAPQTDVSLQICSDIRSGKASLDQLREWAADTSMPEPLRAGIRFELASYLGSHKLADPDSIEEAIREWHKVLQAYPRATAPRRWALAGLELAHCYAGRHQANRTANMREALRLLDGALEVLTEDMYPEDFALAQSRRANLLLDMDTDSSLIDQSLTAFKAALRIYTRDSYPEDWSLVLSNMATAYLTRGGYTGIDDLRQAISLMEQSLSVQTPQAQPHEWALTQINMGLALSRLPASEKGEPHRRAVEALRAAHDVLHVLGDEEGRLSAAYNLGITLTRLEDPLLAEEAIDRLEASLPWLVKTKQTQHAADALTSLAESYMALLDNEVGDKRADEICRRALASFEDHRENEIGLKFHYEVGLWLLTHSQNRSERLHLAGVAFERVLSAIVASRHAEVRASSLANMATVLLLQDQSGKLNRVRARDCMDEAVRILRSLPLTAEREEAIGLILTNKMRSGLDEPYGPTRGGRNSLE